MIRSGCSTPLSGVVIDGGRRSGGVGDDVVLSDLSDQGEADEEVVNQFLAPAIDAAEALGFGDAWGQIPKPLRATLPASRCEVIDQRTKDGAEEANNAKGTHCREDALPGPVSAIAALPSAMTLTVHTVPPP